MRGLPLGAALAGSCWVAAATAGPPLLTDDPVAVAPGHVEIISAVTASERGRNTFVDVTVVDVAAGVVPGLELDLTLDTALSDHDEDDDGQLEHLGTPLSLGFKWEPLRSEAFSLAFAPSVSFGLEHPEDDLAVGFPLLAELRAERLRVGSGARYVVIDGATDGWRLGLYGGLAASPRLELLGEVYASAFQDRADPEVAFNLGADFALTECLHLLASGGTGLYGGAGSRREWAAYLGLQLLLGPLFGGSPAPGPAPPSPGDRALLELTNRQLRRESAPGTLWR